MTLRNSVALHQPGLGAETNELWHPPFDTASERKRPRDVYYTRGDGSSSTYYSSRVSRELFWKVLVNAQQLKESLFALLGTIGLKV